MVKLKRGFHLGLRGKLTAIIILIVFIAVGLVGYISISSMRDEMEKQIEESQMLLAETASEQVQQFFKNAMGVIKLTAQLSAVKDVSSIPFISEEFKGIPREMDAEKRSIMNDVIVRYGDFRYMEQVTPDVGKNIVIEPWAFQLDLKEMDFGHRDWFTGAIDTLDAYLSEVYISSSLGQPVVAISHPVLDDRANLVAVWMGALTLDRLNKLCEQLTFGETGRVYLVDDKGTLAAHQNQELTREVIKVLDVPMVQEAMGG